MNLKKEIFYAKIVTLIIFILFLSELAASGADIPKLFRHYNKKLSQQQAQSFADLVDKAAERFHVEPNVIASIIVVESSARPNVISKGGDYGLMQVRYKVHRIKNLLDPEINIFAGTKIFADCYKKNHNLRNALIRYSGGNKTMARRVLNVLRQLERKK